ncbi:MAG: DUF4251 domain-containing protein [Cyclobacteriaceae bacterium]|nr:DUF4251 domain-containing protein [Cyclobacteriaceae bacterium]
MKRLSIFLVLVLSFVVVTSNAQSFQEQRDAKKKEKAEKRAVQQEEAKANNARLLELVKTKKFVLEANTLYSKSGSSYQLNSTTNFVGFDGENSTIQLAFDGLIGWNGIGGVTLDGTISKMEVKENKKGLGFTINATVRQNVGGAVTMIFRVSSDGSARVDMNGSFGDRLSFQGYIVSLENSRVYKGTSLF